MTLPVDLAYKISMKSATSARNKMMDYLARREHTEKELRTKLSKGFPTDEVEQALDYGKQQGWIANSSDSVRDLADKVATELHRKKKGILYINHFLEEKGLPPIKKNHTEELEKAQELIENKFSGQNWEERKVKEKASRLLISRGFDHETVRKVVYDGIEN
ncbi:MAG: RecX family transcriptional regulator [Bdellovibrio sp. CG10_big_fil_rev_8_21_14_0_10_47_8]|nr:MAG: RecX family transcriptional regulator [Bdellovibrio sp. CG10_big_fil_rev_8_21_14_0_10_47_8]